MEVQRAAIGLDEVEGQRIDHFVAEHEGRQGIGGEFVRRGEDPGGRQTFVLGGGEQRERLDDGVFEAG